MIASFTQTCSELFLLTQHAHYLSRFLFNYILLNTLSIITYFFGLILLKQFWFIPFRRRILHWLSREPRGPLSILSLSCLCRPCWDSGTEPPQSERTSHRGPFLLPFFSLLLLSSFFVPTTCLFFLFACILLQVGSGYRK